MRRNINNKGFTLVELLMATAIVGILAAIAISTYSKFVDKARLVSSVSTMETVVVEIEAYVNDHGGYPISIDFTNFSDQDGNSILKVSGWQDVDNKIFSWDNYSTSSAGYTLVVSAMDRDHTTITVKPKGINY